LGDLGDTALVPMATSTDLRVLLQTQSENRTLPGALVSKGQSHSKSTCRTHPRGCLAGMLSDKCTRTVTAAG
jgi:hypothetical protein